MRKSLWLVLACLALPLAASADSIGIATTGGTISDSASGLSLAGDVITNYGGIGGSNLGTVVFTTGALLSGNVTTGPAAFAGGGSFSITGNGSVVGVPNGVIFSGTFSSPSTWTFNTASSSYTFNGDVTGSGGTATINELTLSGTLNPGGTISVGSGDITLVTTPVTASEPSSLALIPLGLVALLLMRKRMGHVRPSAV